MGYYLDMKVNGEYKFCNLGGKFFGYIDDEVFLKCSSAKFVACCCGIDGDDVYKMLSIPWSCVSFKLNSCATEMFLKLYRQDVLAFKEHPYLDTLDEAISYLKNCKDFEIYEFEMG